MPDTVVLLGSTLFVCSPFIYETACFVYFIGFTSTSIPSALQGTSFLSVMKYEHPPDLFTIPLPQLLSRLVMGQGTAILQDPGGPELP